MTDNDIENAAKLLRPATLKATPVQVLVKVRPLVWIAGDGQSRSVDCWKADDGFGGSYTVIEGQWRHGDGEFHLAGDNGLAKAAAQADHDASILSRLEVITASQHS
jgi:hypothetical protein